jgi:hypothetical protein
MLPPHKPILPRKPYSEWKFPRRTVPYRHMAPNWSQYVSMNSTSSYRSKRCREHRPLRKGLNAVVLSIQPIPSFASTTRRSLADNTDLQLGPQEFCILALNIREYRHAEITLVSRIPTHQGCHQSPCAGDSRHRSLTGSLLFSMNIHTVIAAHACGDRCLAFDS